ncbi:hypothetical protein [Gemmatimonas sp.]|uniref:hypothetical protein n=1 Tax=Gemmatimonas sp. TaxID=1962908 RepID=UPI0025BF705A|nr:hypothetical protein [Gemmatimonas sp.]MCA2991625.1 hypothetical protein [Gemmatimonas sp.]
MRRARKKGPSPVRTPYGELSPPLNADIRTLYEMGESSCDLAACYATNPGRILASVRAAGGQARPMNEAVRRYHVNDQFFRRINSEEVAYVLGLLYADGNVRDTPSPTVNLALKSEDRGHLVKVLAIMDADYKIYDAACSSRFTITSARLVADLKRHGVEPRKSLTAQPPELPEKWRRHFWRGVFDGDGCISLPMKGINLVGTLDTVSVFRALCREIVPGTRANLHPIRRQRRTWGYNLTGMYALAVLEELYRDCTIALDRKASLLPAMRDLVSKMRRPRSTGHPVLHGYSSTPAPRRHHFRPLVGECSRAA